MHNNSCVLNPLNPLMEQNFLNYVNYKSKTSVDSCRLLMIGNEFYCKETFWALNTTKQTNDIQLDHFHRFKCILK